MGESITHKGEYALRVQRLIDAVKELEECAFELPEKREEAVYVLDTYSGSSKQSGKLLKYAADEIAALSMLEILHEG